MGTKFSVVLSANSDRVLDRTFYVLESRTISGLSFQPAGGTLPFLFMNSRRICAINSFEKNDSKRFRAAVHSPARNQPTDSSQLFRCGSFMLPCTVSAADGMSSLMTKPVFIPAGTNFASRRVRTRGFGRALKCSATASSTSIRTPNFLVSDSNRDDKFTTGPNTSTFAKSNAPGFHHSSWDVGSLHEVGLGAEQMKDSGYTKGWGLGRHVLGSNYFYYLRDPWGSYAEYSYDIDFVPADLDWPTADHPPEDSLYVWGPAVPEDFVTNFEAAARG